MTQKETNDFNTASSQRKHFLRLKEEEARKAYRKSLMTWDTFWDADCPGN